MENTIIYSDLNDSPQTTTTKQFTAPVEPNVRSFRRRAYAETNLDTTEHGALDSVLEFGTENDSILIQRMALAQQFTKNLQRFETLRLADIKSAKLADKTTRLNSSASIKKFLKWYVPFDTDIKLSVEIDTCDRWNVMKGDEYIGRLCVWDKVNKKKEIKNSFVILVTTCGNVIIDTYVEFISDVALRCKPYDCMCTLAFADLNIEDNGEYVFRKQYGKENRKRKINYSMKDLKSEAGIFDIAGHALDSATDAIVARVGDRIKNRVREAAVDIGSKFAYVGQEFTEDTMVSRLEDIILTCSVCFSTDNIATITAAILMYLKTWNVGKSVLKTAMEIFTSVLDLNNINMGDGNRLHSESFELNDLIDGFNTFKSTGFCAKINDLLSLLFFFGFLPDEWKDKVSNNFTVGIKQFSFKLTKINDMADFNWVSILAETTHYFFTRIYSFITSGDWSVFYMDDDVEPLEQTYNHLMASAYLLELNRIHTYTAPGNDEVMFANGREWLQFCETAINGFKEAIGYEKLNRKKDTHIIEIMSRKIKDLQIAYSRYLTFINSQNIQEKPFGLLLLGGSGVGKSTVCNILKNAIGSVNGFKTSNDETCVLNDGDEYQSDFKAHHNVVIFDDLCNAMPGQKSKSPLDPVLKYFNNVATSAVKADIDSKGSIPFGGKLGIATTNVKSLNASIYSQEPVSILRRFEYHIEVSIKPKYRNTAGQLCSVVYGLEAASGDTPDAWEFHVYSIGKREENGRDLPVEIPHGTFGIHDLCRFITAKSKEHYAKEASVVSSMKSGRSTCMECGIGISFSAGDYCRYCFAKRTAHALPPLNEEVGEVDNNPHFNLETIISLQRIHSVEDLRSSTFVQVRNMIEAMERTDHRYMPSEEHSQHISFVHNFLTLQEQFGADSVEGRFLTEMISYLSLEDTPTRPPIGWTVRINLIYDRITDCLRSARQDLVSHWEDRKRAIIRACWIGATYAAGAGAYYAFYKLYRGMCDKIKINNKKPKKSIFETQSTPHVPVPTSLDRKVTPFKIKYLELSESAKCSKTTSYDNFVEKLEGAMATFVIPSPDKEGVMRCSMLMPLRNSFWLAPKHLFEGYEKGTTIPFSVVSTREVSGTLSTWYDTDANLSDVVILNLPALGTCPNLIRFFPIKAPSHPKNVKLLKVWHNGETNMLQDLVDTSSVDVVNVGKDISFIGFNYTTTRCRTDSGWCISPVISSQREIIGVHLAGSGSDLNPVGAAQILTFGMLTKALEAITIEPLKVCPLMGEKLEFYGKKMEVNKHVPIQHVLSRVEGTELSPEVTILGTTEIGRSTMKTQYKNFDHEELLDRLDLTNNYLVPSKANMMVEGLKVSTEYNRDFSLISNTHDNLDTGYLDLAKESYIADLVDVFNTLPNKEKENMCVYPMSVAVNGVDAMNFVNGLDLTTSGGVFKPGSKRKYCIESPDKLDHCTRHIEFDDDVKEQVLDYIKSYSRGERKMTPFKTVFKDEPLKKGKGKMRLMSSSDLAFTIVVKMYYQSIVRFMCSNWVETGIAVGINPMGPQWSELASSLQSKGENIIAGDFSNFDKRMNSQMILAAFDVMLQLARQANYDDDDIRIMSVIAYEVAYPVYLYDGVLLMCNGSHPSGNPLTPIVNSIVNILYNRYTFKIVYPKLDFKEYVYLITYGDDSVANVSKGVPHWNYNVINQLLGYHKVAWTDSNKSPILAEKGYDKLEDIDFLKRGFKWDDDTNRWLAPLAQASLAKQLSFHKCSGQQREIDDVFINNCMNVVREYAMYGRLEYNYCTDVVTEYLGEKLDHYFKPKTFDEVIDDGALELPKNYNTDKVFYLSDSDSCVELQAEGALILPFTIRDCIVEQECHQGQVNKIANGRLNHLTFKELITKGTNRERAEHAQSVTGELDVTNSSQGEVVLHPQMDVISFDELNINKMYMDYPLDRTFMSTDDSLTIQQFLARPTRIIQPILWDVKTPFKLRFQPWEEWLNDVRVSEKLRNFRNLTGTLCLKFIVNGTKFHFGRMLIAYEPLHKARVIPYFTDDPPISNFIPQRAIDMQTTQRPCVQLNPTDNVGAVMKLPFISPMDCIDLAEITTRQLGEIVMYDLSQLNTLGTNTTPVTIQVYAWMENATVSVPTLYAENDEYSSNVISQPATSIAALASKLTGLPIIGEYAKATELAASVTATVAKMAGLSKPINLDPISPMISRTCGDMATFNSKDSSVKLSMDIKQELTIDPRVVGGSPEDELNITSLCARECMIGKFVWNPENPAGARLLSIAVTPMMYVVSSNVDAVITTPAAFVASFFQSWRANMCYRFEPVVSGFHSGRLRIVYEPVESSTQDQPSFNTNYTWIVDLRSTPMKCIEVGWCAPTKFLTVPPNGNIFANTPWNEETENWPNAWNGTITVYVETPLVVPESTSIESVEVLVYSKCLNPTFAQPTSQLTGTYALLPESGEVDGVGTQRDDGVVEVSETMKAKEVPNVDESTLVFYGEVIPSMRCLMKRYNLTESYFSVFEDLPLRLVTRFKQAAPGTSTYNASNLNSTRYDNTITFVSVCFATVRGSYRKKIFQEYRAGFEFDNQPVLAPLVSASIDTFSLTTTKLEFVVDEEANPISSYKNAITGSSGIMRHCFSPDARAAEFEVPFYSNSRFSSPRYLSVVSDFAPLEPTILRTSQPLYAHQWYSQRTSSPLYNEYTAIGEDFLLSTFVCTPLLFLVTNV